MAALSVALAQCSFVEDIAVAPGSFTAFSCEQLAVKGREAAERERKLKDLMDKAEQSVGGGIISALAYRSDYLTAVAELKNVDAAAADRKCPTPWHSISDRSMW